MRIRGPKKHSWVRFSHYRAVVTVSDLPFAKPSIALAWALLPFCWWEKADVGD